MYSMSDRYVPSYGYQVDAEASVTCAIYAVCAEVDVCFIKQHIIHKK
jgi:hypothetical protein